MPSIRSLHTFLAVARLGSFAAAGKEVGLTAAAVGQRMAALEAEWRQPLFDRGARQVSLGPAGRAAVAPVQDLLARYEALAAPATAASGLRGRLQVGALVSALMGEFADAMWSLKREHPSLELRLVAGLSSDFALRVERGELDAAIVTQPPQRLARDLAWTRLYSEPMVLIVPRRPHFELAATPLAALRGSPFLRFDRHTWTGALVEQALRQCRAGAVRDELELNSVEAIIALVRQGIGVSIVPQLRNVDWARDRALRVLALPRLTVQRHVGLLERRDHARAQYTAAIKAYFERPSSAAAKISA
ncbi:MAG: LysR family transcriptional regulator [Burkholderiales bacterium]|nr:LysR family transcriptional regulator [Burkholderiales bacterium]